MELMVLVLEIILLIIKLKISPEDATRATAKKYNVAFSELWSKVPKYWK